MPKIWQEREDSNPRPLVLESNGICHDLYCQAPFSTDILNHNDGIYAWKFILSGLVAGSTLAKWLAETELRGGADITDCIFLLPRGVTEDVASFGARLLG